MSNVGPMGGILGSAAGAPMAQKGGAEAERASQDAGSQQRKVATDKKAQDAAGVGKTDGDHEAGDRDADGRRLWEQGPEVGDAEAEAEKAPERKSKSVDDDAGNSLDLSG